MLTLARVRIPFALGNIPFKGPLPTQANGKPDIGYCKTLDEFLE